MKSDKLIDAVGLVSDDLIEDALKPNLRARRNKKIKIAVLVASLLVVCITASVLLGGKNHISTNVENSSSKPTQSTPALSIKDCEILKAAYPTQVKYPDFEGNSLNFDEEYKKWKQDLIRRHNEYKDAVDIKEFLKNSIPEMLLNKKGENAVYSPLNVYMALSILAEITDGESREQILSVLGAKNIESLRNDAKALWNQNYNDDGRYTSILAASLWLNDALDFNNDTVMSVVKNYYASVFGGEMGSDELNAALQKWLNEQTGNLLKDQIGSLKLYPETVLSIVTTLYFKAGWQDFFSEGRTEKDTFYANSGEIECDFMRQSGIKDYYRGEDFTAIEQPFKDNSGGMYFILPNEDKSPEEIIRGENVLKFISSNGENGAEKTQELVNLSLPKFDVSSQIEFSQSLKNLGIIDVFKENKADFSPITSTPGTTVSSAIHGARVVVDEKGCTAAAYTVISLSRGVSIEKEPIDFTLDRPFIFVITSESGLPLFTGIVNTPA